MKIRRLRSRLHRAAMLIGLVVATAIPLGYAWVAYEHEASQLEFKARLSAARLAKYIYANERMWQYHQVRLAEIIEFNEISDDLSQTVADASGRNVLVTGKDQPTPRLSRSVPIEVGGRRVGTLIAAVSLQPLLWRSAVVAVASVLLALLTYAVVRLLPIRALDTTLGVLRSTNEQLSRVNRELTDQAEKLAEAQQLGRIGYWSYRLDDEGVWWSPELFALLELDPATFVPLRDTPLSLMNEAHGRILRAAQTRVLRDNVVETVDVRIRKASGAVGDFSVTSKALVDDHGNVIGLSGTLQDITDRKSAEEQLERLAYLDPLTGLANRALFARQLEATLREAVRSDGLRGLLLIDLDRFKEVNDTLGHNAGDQLLIEVVRRIRAVLGPDDFFARLGGDEFAIVTGAMSSRDAIEALIRLVLASLEGQIDLDAGVVSAGASIGVAVLVMDGMSAGELMRNADLALYRAKDAGRGMARFFEVEMSAEMQNKAALARDLKQSLDDDRGLELFYQPQVDLRTGRIMGFEALVRWTHPERGSIAPAEFIPIAEESRLICELGTWVLRTAARQARAWLDAGEPEREIAVNVSAAQIWKSNLIEQVDGILAETRLPPHLLCIELTESLMAEQEETRVRVALEGLRKRGITLALDDFGTGYSSLGYLSELPFDQLKIDQLFIRKMNETEHDRELLRGIIALGHGLRMKVLAEGTETTDEVATLMQLGADYVQGFAFSAAVPADQALAFAREHETNTNVRALLSVLEAARRKAA